MIKDRITLEELKEEYSPLQKKYNLPKFEQLNEDFSIEKATETETEILIREIRRFVGEKIINYLRFVEGLLNPVNGPMFVFSIIKILEPSEKQKLSDIYKELVKQEIKFIELDLEFDEKKEADFIIEANKLWQDVKKDLLGILEGVNNRWDNKSEGTNKGYFG
ncbi:hypothetical protein K0A97_00590 [Patescibacteria group bacterium]|nr:hypothetical protein [Patescibacteria group bacterium]